jgi:hypothetical protein
LDLANLLVAYDKCKALHYTVELGSRTVGFDLNSSYYQGINIEDSDKDVPFYKMNFFGQGKKMRLTV